MQNDLFKSPRRGLVAFILGALIVSILNCVDLQYFLGPMNYRNLQIFTPYYPGMDKIDEHEIFNPRFKKFKKIVFVGSSSADSVGCDGSWSKPDIKRIPNRNVHYSCRISHHLEQLIHKSGRKDVKVFNISNNGVALMPIIYTYFKISKIKPELVIYGGGKHFMSRNGDWDNLILKPRHSTFLEKKLSSDAYLAATWEELKEVFKMNGWNGKKGIDLSLEVKDIEPIVFKDKIELNEVFFKLIASFDLKKLYDDMPLPVKIYPFNENYKTPGKIRPTQKYNFDYLIGLSLINKNQIRDGNKFVVYQSPVFSYRNITEWDEVFSIPYIAKLRSMDIINFDLTDLNLEFETEVYDNSHHTIYGNKKIAKEIFLFLHENNILETM